MLIFLMLNFSWISIGDLNILSYSNHVINQTHTPIVSFLSFPTLFELSNIINLEMAEWIEFILLHLREMLDLSLEIRSYYCLQSIGWATMYIANHSPSKVSD